VTTEGKWLTQQELVHFGLAYLLALVSIGSCKGILCPFGLGFFIQCLGAGVRRGIAQCQYPFGELRCVQIAVLVGVIGREFGVSRGSAAGVGAAGSAGDGTCSVVIGTSDAGGAAIGSACWASAGTAASAKMLEAVKMRNI
jgi:hypothetical protein